MDCNKDEAVRAKEIAERKFTERNYAVAKKFAVKAHNLYPGLEGLSQMLTTLDVYISADIKINGEADWYGILGANPLDDDETIKKQYRKLALVLHPDKNKSIGAEGAFKLVSEAWSLLSDKAKRLAYNQKRNLKGFQQKVPTQTGGSSAANGRQHPTSNVASNVRTQQTSSRTSFTSVPSFKKTDTFWTICNRCKTHYEYLRIYLNHTLLCPNCHEAFMALEKDPPPNVFKQSNWSSRQHPNSGHTSATTNPFNSGKNYPATQNVAPGVSMGSNSFNRTNFQWGFSKTAGDRSTVATSSAAAQAASVVQQASEKVKREREERQSAAEWERSHLFKGMTNPHKVDRPLKKRNLENNLMNGYRGYVGNQMVMNNGGAGVGGVYEIRKGNSEMDRFYEASGAYVKSNRVRELSYPETKNMLMDKARTKIRSMLEKWRSMSVAGTENKEKDKVNKKQKRVVKGDKENLRYSNSSDINKESVAGNAADGTKKEGEPGLPVSINVPDPDFHNFDLDRTENSFGEEQVWAAYDDDDGMPRFYARIHRVISLKPFRMRISWLNSRSNSELGPIDWIGSGFTKTCGDFRIGRHESTGTLNSFSHKVSWTKGLRGAIRIYPKKTEVWALYKNWSPEWNEHTPDEVIHKYEMVEVIDDYNEEQGVAVAPLIKVSGFKTVFRMHMDPKEVRKIPKEEMFRFSHQIPYHLLTGEEADNAPKGCRELDPAATPLELIQETTEANEVPSMENGEKAAEQMPQNAPIRDADEIMKSASVSVKAEITENGEQTKDVR
ncbi:Terminal organelle assembly protein [Trema orientale]|uniref:Terminal organelle assembly protein n=1 Tax=Trema orientale TaxID=63057 RepID=A0A2P5FGE9_TREOI|nr:Terminal organelle assembly protein [Trema orientale]